MSLPWTYLLHRYGNEVAQPHVDQIRLAAFELYHEVHPALSEADYAEHGSASLRYGFDDGPMYVLEISRSGRAVFEEWADQDFLQPLCPPKELIAISELDAIDLWSRLSSGEIEYVRRVFDRAA